MTLIFFVGVAVIGGLYTALACNALSNPNIKNIGLVVAYAALIVLSTCDGSPVELREIVCPN